MLASGLVLARLELPSGILHSVLPDVLPSFLLIIIIIIILSFLRQGVTVLYSPSWPKSQSVGQALNSQRSV